MPNRLAQLIRALRGPVVLMTAGSLFWLRQAYDLSFSTTWPVLIIVFGVMKLLEAMAPRMESHEQRPYGGGLS